VAEYDYAVSKFPLILEKDGKIFKGLQIGEYDKTVQDKINTKLTLIVLTGDSNSEEFSLVESRNAPYLTAQGYFKVASYEYDWVFAARVRMGFLPYSLI